jgi:hypothetical protein
LGRCAYLIAFTEKGWSIGLDDIFTFWSSCCEDPDKWGGALKSTVAYRLAVLLCSFRYQCERMKCLMNYRSRFNIEQWCVTVSIFSTFHFSTYMQLLFLLEII